MPQSAVAMQTDRRTRAYFYQLESVFLVIISSQITIMTPEAGTPNIIRDLDLTCVGQSAVPERPRESQSFTGSGIYISRVHHVILKEVCPSASRINNKISNQAKYTGTDNIA